MRQILVGGSEPVIANEKSNSDNDDNFYRQRSKKVISKGLNINRFSMKDKSLDKPLQAMCMQRIMMIYCRTATGKYVLEMGLNRLMVPIIQNYLKKKQTITDLLVVK